MLPPQRPDDYKFKTPPPVSILSPRPILSELPPPVSPVQGVSMPLNIAERDDGLLIEQLL